MPSNNFASLANQLAVELNGSIARCGKCTRRGEVTTLCDECTRAIRVLGSFQREAARQRQTKAEEANKSVEPDTGLALRLAQAERATSHGVPGGAQTMLRRRLGPSGSGSPPSSALGT